jgi:hypothetical protein
MAQRPDLPVDGATITSAWGSTVRDQIVTPFSSSANRASEIGSPVAGQVTTLTPSSNNNGLYVHNGTSWRAPWNMPWGVVTISALPGAFGGTGTQYSSTFTFSSVANRFYRVTMTGDLENSTVTASNIGLGIYNNAGTLQVIYPTTNRAGANEHGFAGGSYLYQSAATGTQTWKVGMVNPSGSVTVTYTPTALLIEDIGPNGAPV